MTDTHLSSKKVVTPLTERELTLIYRLPFSERSLISMRNHAARLLAARVPETKP